MKEKKNIVKDGNKWWLVVGELNGVGRMRWGILKRYLMVLFVAVGALDIISDKVPASNNLADQEEGVGLSSDQTGLQVLVLGDVLPCVGRAGRLDKLEGGLLGRLDLSARGRGHTLTNVDLLGNLTSDLGVVDDGAYCVVQRV